jgi:hypothetical protein
LLLLSIYFNNLMVDKRIAKKKSTAAPARRGRPREKPALESDPENDPPPIAEPLTTRSRPLRNAKLTEKATYVESEDLTSLLAAEEAMEKSIEDVQLATEDLLGLDDPVVGSLSKSFAISALVVNEEVEGSEFELEEEVEQEVSESEAEPSECAYQS